MRDHSSGGGRGPCPARTVYVRTMALVTCLDCKKEISDVAPACPGCGRPTTLAAPTPTPDVARAPAVPTAPAASGSVGPVGVVLVIGVAILIGWWMLSTHKDTSGGATPEATSLVASIPYAGDDAIAKGCAGFVSEETQTQGDRVAVAGDKEAFGRILQTTGARHIAIGERVRVTGLGEKSDHRRIEDSSGKGWWVGYSCLTKVP
jgi:hypothetical protein